jgi:hypothetical protein
MKKGLLIWLGFVWGCVQVPRDIPPESWRGWPEVWTLRGGGLEVRLLPARGRMIPLAETGGGNLLWELPEMRGVMERDRENRWSWPNPGGDWLWPVQQSEWHRLGVPDKWRWPPPAVFDDRPWTVRRESPGVVEMRLEVGEPLRVRLTRRFVLSDREPGVLRVRQRIERMGESDIPVTLWHITQVPTPREVRFEHPADSAFADGVHRIGAEEVNPASLRREEGMWIWDPSKTGRCKFGTDGRWLEAELEGGMLRIEARGGRGGGMFPDGGCSLALVKGKGGDFVELETMSVERNPEVGGVLENELVYRWVRDGR